MTNNISPISTLSNLYGGTGTQPSSSTSSTADIISSFKEIMSMMTATNSLSSGSNTSSFYPSTDTGMNMSNLMAPLMLLMLERLIEQQIDKDSSPTATSGSPSSVASSLTSTGAVYGSKPEPSGRPVAGPITQYPHTGHMAFDIGIPVGTPIKTTMDGKVVSAGWNDQGYGNLVIVENGAYRTYYAHLSSIPVSVGDAVTAGTVIGLSGNTGHSTGPHLHYEIRKNKVAIDPTTATLGS